MCELLKATTSELIGRVLRFACCRHLPGPVAAGHATRVRRARQRALRPRLALPAHQTVEGLDDLLAERLGGGWRRRRPRRRARPQGRRLERRLRAQGAQRRPARPQALPRRKLQELEEVHFAGEAHVESQKTLKNGGMSKGLFLF